MKTTWVILLVVLRIWENAVVVELLCSVDRTLVCRDLSDPKELSRCIKVNYPINEIKIQNSHLSTLPSLEEEPELKIIRSLTIQNSLVAFLESPVIYPGKIGKSFIQALSGLDHINITGVSYLQSWNWKLVNTYSNTSVLNIENCRFVHIPDTFGTLSTFEVVKIKRSEVHWIHKDAFLSCGNIFFLHLSHNKIRKLENGLFFKCRNLRDLSLRNNLIEHLPEDVFPRKMTLFKLDLSGNPLVTLSFKMFENITILKQFHLTETHIKCNCSYTCLLLKRGLSLTSVCSHTDDNRTNFAEYLKNCTEASMLSPMEEMILKGKL